MVEQSEDMETAGGYAKEASDDYKKTGRYDERCS